MRIIEDLALVLSGGSYKVMFQIAALIFLEKLGVYPKAIYAISGGVPNAIAYMLRKARGLPGIWFRVDPKKFYSIAWSSLILWPIFKGKKPGFGAQAILKSKLLTKVVDEEIDFSALLESPIILWVGVADLRTGTVKWFSNKDEGMTAVRFRLIVLAAMRIPVFFQPIEDGEAQFTDAGLTTNFPIGHAIRAGFRRIIAINAFPRTLPDISGLGTWPEIEMRNADISHLKEGERHREAIEQTNKHLLGVAEIKANLCPNCLERVVSLIDALPRSKKRILRLCQMNTPSNLAIFKKEGSYGYPSEKARFELLGAGAEAVTSTLMPFLANEVPELVGAMPESAEFVADFQKNVVASAHKTLGRPY